MSKKRLRLSGLLIAFTVRFALSQEQSPLRVSGIFSTGYYATTTRGEANQSLSFIPVGSRFDMSGYYLTPDLLSFSAQPELNFGPQATEAGFQGGNGIRL